MIRIKKQNKNEYIYAEGLWIRNPYINVNPLDLNDMFREEIGLFLGNETKNLSLPCLHSDEFNDSAMENVVICSDGHDWERAQEILAEIPNKNVKVIGINGSLKKWNMVAGLSEKKRVMSAYFVNNPYKECLSYLPNRHRYYPSLVASTRTNPEFISGYLEKPTFYRPTNDGKYSGIPRDGCVVLDDYRNPLCGAISYCVRKRVKKLALFCCDEAFTEERPGSEKMENGLFQYPQQIMSQKVVDAQLHWLRSAGVQVADSSSGIEYKNATYIKNEELPSFF
jgi:hypothetical protein